MYLFLQSNNGPTNRGWSACADVKLTLNIAFHSSIPPFFLMYLPILNTYLLTYYILIYLSFHLFHNTYLLTYYILIYLSILTYLLITYLFTYQYLLTHLRLLSGSGSIGGSGQSRVASCKELFNKGFPA